MGENVKPPIDFEEGVQADSHPAEELDELEQQQLSTRINSEREEKVAAEGGGNQLHQGVIDGHFEEQARREIIQEQTRNPEVKEEERHIVGSFPELMIRGKERGQGALVRIWDMGVEEGVNTTTRVPLKYQKAVPSAGEHIDGRLYRVRMPYEFEFDCIGPDLNNPGKSVGFWGGRINARNFPEWLDRVDMGPDYSHRSQDDYDKLFQDEIRKDDEKHMRRRK